MEISDEDDTTSQITTRSGRSFGVVRLWDIGPSICPAACLSDPAGPLETSPAVEDVEPRFRLAYWI